MTTPQILQPIPPGDGSGGVLPSSFVIGDILYADSTSTLHALADVAVGSVLVSGGVGAAPAWSATSASKFGSVAIGGATIGTDVLAIAGKQTNTLTTTQLRLAYDGSNYTDFTVGSTGGLTLGGAGGGTASLVASGGVLGGGLSSAYYNSNTFQLPSAGRVVFTSGVVSGTIDTGFSRDSVLGAGNIDLGNGTANDKSGTLNLAKIVFSSAASGIVLKQGANGLCGTFVANGVTPVTVSNTNVAITDAIIISLNTVGGTVGANPPDVQTITAGTGFTVKGLTLDTSTYNYAIIKNAA